MNASVFFLLVTLCSCSCRARKLHGEDAAAGEVANDGTAPAPGPASQVRPQMSTRSCWQEMADGALNLYEEKTGQCLHGSWCGSGCVHTNYEDPSVDELDEACKQHDICLYPDGTGTAAPDPCQRCYCDQILKDTSRQLYNYNARCTSVFDCFNPLCVETGMVSNAISLSMGMSKNMGDYSCDSMDFSGCYPGYNDPALAEGPEPDGSSSPTEDEAAGCPYDFFSDADLSGGDLSDGTVSAGSADECCQTCSDHPDCYAWTFAPDNMACDGPCCFLKDSSWTENVATAGLVSGTYQTEGRRLL